MADEAKRPLKVFLCHASGDKPPVRELYKRLVAEGVDAWLDQEKLMPGQDWQLEIPRAVREADVVVVCLSNKSITKEGYIQKELKFALDIAEEKPEGTIFLIPARLEDCAVPERLSRWHWVDLFEENGFLRLLRSLKLRADRVGATIEPQEYESEDQEVERRLDHLYTEGLAAFYTEDWDRAYQRFQAILRERPSHKNAAEKLAQAERQRNFVKLYAQATEAYKAENWLVAIKALEELLGKSQDYKDAAQLLKDAKKQKQLTELYVEAKRLHTAQKWQAVIRVFDQIAEIDSAYPDPEGLLPSAQKEAAELKRLAELNDLYSQGVRKVDAGQWYEARDLLEQVHKAQIGFLDTERLLRKVENEIIRIEELKRRNNQINILYEQAHGLIRSKSWRMVLDKMGEIRKLDDQFVDRDEIFEKARLELEQEEQAAQQQNELAAMYAGAVRLLKEGKYQEALDKWQEVRSIDPKYPDRQRVQSIARRKLTESGTSPQNKRGLVIANPVRTGMIGLIAIGIIVAGIILSARWNEETPPTATSSGSVIAIPTLTTSPAETDQPQDSATVPPTVVVDPLMYDDFNNPTYDGRFNTALWNADVPAGKIVQENGLLTFELNDYPAQIGMAANKSYKPASPMFVESKIMLDRTSREGAIWAGFGSSSGDIACAIFAPPSEPEDGCSSELELPQIPQEWFVASMSPGLWHVIRIELYPDTVTFVFFVDGNKIGSYVPQDPDKLKDLSYMPLVYVSTGTDSTPGVTGYVDYVKIGEIEEYETKETVYRWDFGKDWDGWGDYNHISFPKAADGYITFRSTGPDPWIFSQPSLHIDASLASVITIRMRVQGTRISGRIFFVTDQDNNWDGAKSIEFTLSQSDTFQTYHVVMMRHPAWRGVVTQLRLDPIDQPDPLTSESQMAIDYISVHAP